MDQVVVGAAVVRRGAVLAARRTSPPESAGRWELPGGKVEAGETPVAAVVRELAEELGCTVAVTGWVEGRVPIRPGLVLTVALARLVDGEPEPVEHDEVRWLTAAEVHDVDWLEPDRPFLPALVALLAKPQARGVFDDRDTAEEVVALLRTEGYAAWSEREAFAGEDDDEDHSWAVVTDAPDVRLELLTEEHEGWFDVLVATEPALGTGPAPLDLPRAPRR
ncbi:(deoxy)nucleoside triphosphate pyrophosphohydrolase [Nocardioides marmoribigeumensis]|uniref:8-oxo-dGTP diphosphatase n=1 Tax=Nocardioides marmoribigeumensis TaxID=433649 RepID=A0ABU2BVF0_9ACTN|nr:(deoxy)nucleoside triphosphate pyrophosphohydrolase [Nocardioides marmoribigeumensis]MDR7362618.1 mutator protein MutT [Nocardioides marmoribigeumensis]